jgi:hypothetical protein
LTFWYDRRLWHVDGRFTREQAKQLIKGERFPNLDYPIVGQHPYLWQENDHAIIDPCRLEITVTSVEGRGGMWRVRYSVMDARPNLLARGNGYTDRQTDSIGSSDRAMPGNLHSEPEAIDPGKIGLTKSDYRHRERVTTELPKEAARRLDRRELNRLRRVKREAEAKGVSTVGLDTAIERELQKIEEQLRHAA